MEVYLSLGLYQSLLLLKTPEKNLFSFFIMRKENLAQGENSEHQRELSLRGKRKMEYEAEDEPESLSGQREPEECRRLKIESDMKHRAKKKERMKADSDAILDEWIMDNQLNVSEKYEAGNKAHGKLKKVMEFIKHEELNNEELSYLVKIFQDRNYRAYKKVEEEEYNILAEQMNESLKETLETVENIRVENKTLQNDLKEMACKMEEMESLKMLKDDVEAKRLKEETMYKILLNQLESYVQEYGKRPEHNFDGLPNVGGGLLPTSQVRGLGANETPNAILDAEDAASTTGHSNEENLRLQQQVYELKKDVEAFRNLMLEHYKNLEMNGCIHTIAEAQLGVGH